MAIKRLLPLVIVVITGFPVVASAQDVDVIAGAHASRRLVRPRVTMEGTARGQVRWSPDALMPSAGTQSAEGRAQVRLSARTILLSTQRWSFVRGTGDDAAVVRQATGVNAAATLGVMHRVSRRTTVGVSYRYDRASFAGGESNTATGAGIGLSRVASRYLTWQVGYDAGWSRVQSHAALVAAVYRLPSDEHTSVSLAFRPTITSGAAGAVRTIGANVRVDRRLDGGRRVGVGYARSVSLLEVADRAVVTNVFTAQVDSPLGSRATIGIAASHGRGTGADGCTVVRTTVRVGVSLALTRYRE